jgi:hypothetical protein
MRSRALGGEMKEDIRPYLIQRMKLRHQNEPTGFDQMWSLDYMGAAEFEYGALPQSLREITRELDRYVVTPVEPKVIAHDGRRLYILSKTECVDDIQSLVPGLKDGTTHLKELTYLKESLFKPGSIEASFSHSKFDGWWDIENNYMLILGDKAANRTVSAIGLYKTSDYYKKWETEQRKK